MNLEVMKCYSLLFTNDGIIYNIGSYILLAIIFCCIILLIYFWLKGHKTLNNQITELINLNKNQKKENLETNNDNTNNIKNINNIRNKKMKKKGLYVSKILLK